jgi:predicted phage gp36 major capsid-like protein
MNEQKSLIDRVSRATGDVGKPVVSATRDHAKKASRAARSQLPATREDIARLTDQLDRVEAALAELADRLEAPKPKRRAASTGSAKPES